MTLELTWGIDDATAAAELARIRESRIQWARISNGWKLFEPVEGFYDEEWAATVERAVESLRKLGVGMIMDLSQVPGWANGNAGDNYPPTSNAKYAAYCRETVRRWGDRVRYFGVWNEANHPAFWLPTPSAPAYVALHKAAYTAMKAENPDVQVCLGPISFNDYVFLEQCYAVDANFGDWFDVIDVHPYTRGGVSPETVFNDGPGGRISVDSFTGYKEVGAVMATHGDLKPIIASEFGWSTCSPVTSTGLGCVTEATQADYIERAFKLMQGAYLRQETYYILIACVYIIRQDWHGPDPPASDWVSGLDLLRWNFGPKPAFTALAGVRAPGWRL